MLNYTKSELYRIVHGRELYLFTGVLCAIVLLSSVLLWAMASTPDFPYATVRFSLSNLISMLPSLFLLAGLLVWCCSPTIGRTARSRTPSRTAARDAICSWASVLCPRGWGWPA